MIVDPNELFMRQLMSTFYVFAFGSEKTDKEIWKKALSHQMRYHGLSPFHAALLENEVPKRNTPYTREQVIEYFSKYIIEHKREREENSDFYKNIPEPDAIDSFAFYCEDLYHEGRISYEEASMYFELTKEEVQYFNNIYRTK